MASTTATYYRSGVQQSSGYVGTLGYDGGPVVGRFQFTTPNTGASSFSFSSTTLGPTGSTTGSSGDPTAFRWAITENASVNIGKYGTDGYTVAVDWGDPNHLTSNGSKTVQLLPNKTYYLWIYPSGTSYNRWAIGSITVTFGGVYGTPSTFTALPTNTTIRSICRHIRRSRHDHAVPQSQLGAAHGQSELPRAHRDAHDERLHLPDADVDTGGRHLCSAAGERKIHHGDDHGRDLLFRLFCRFEIRVNHDAVFLC